MPHLHAHLYDDLRRSVIAALIVALLATPHLVRAESAATLDDYQRMVREAYAAAQRSDRIGLDQVAGTLLGTTGVRLSDGTVLHVNNDWLKHDLMQEPPAYKDLTLRLGAILDGMNQPHGTYSPDAEAKLQATFEVPPFKDRAVPQGMTSAWTNFWSAVGRGILRVLRWLFNRPSPRPIQPPSTPATPTVWTSLGSTGTIFLIVGLVLVLILVGSAVRGLRSSFLSDRKVRKASSSEEVESAAAAGERAREQMERGDYRNAMRSLYLSSLLWLHEHHILRYDRSQTNREYLQQLGGTPFAGQLKPIVDTFDRTWYGNVPVGEEEFAQFQQQIEQLRSNGPAA